MRALERLVSTCIVAVAQDLPLTRRPATQWCPGSRGDIAATLGRHPGVVLDIGAFDGADAVAYAAAGDHEVYAFEPTPFKAEMIESAIAASKHGDRIHYVPRALGARVSNMTYWVAKNRDHGQYRGHLGSQQDSFDKPSSEAIETVVAVDTLDHWFASLKSPPLEILYAKIDAQGHDHSVLAGGHGLLASRIIRILAFEVTPGGGNLDKNISRGYVNEYLRAVRELLGFGYKCSDCCPSSGKWAGCMKSRPADFSPVDLGDYLRGLAKSGTWTNIICHIRGLTAITDVVAPPH